MKRVINWAHYKDNWADFAEATAGIFLDLVISLACLCTVAPVALVLVVLGFAPSFDEEQ